PHGDFAHYWLHNEMLQVEGKKMSKSLGNFFTVRDLLDKGIPGEVIRFVFLMTHYRSPMDWTEEKEGQARVELSKWRTATDGVEASPPPALFVSALADDLNTHAAITEMRGLFKSGRFDQLKGAGNLVGMLTEEMAWSHVKHYVMHAEPGTFKVSGHAPTISVSRPLLESISNRFAELRQAAIVSKDFSAVDNLKSALIAAGIEVRMSKSGVELVPGSDFDPAKLEALQ
ncbi:MAG: hypothetical protein EON48_10445, partial [Acetobacteraceae bacterium]